MYPKENVGMSLCDRDFLRRAHELLRSNDDDDDDDDDDDEEEVDVQFQEHGYLLLAASEAGEGSIVPKQIKRKILRRKGRGDGSDPWALIRRVGNKSARAMGVNVRERTSPRRRPGGMRKTMAVRVLSVDVLVEDRNVVRI
ncbi:hypothetical protein ACHAXA_007411 [Cyclostephanos tholiformis]|uniref:Uncharacterized protein n=1 Tax=Cyclostephanos tholiformis TaxID=382380 RepID=A0ABD3RLA1_9STRA